MFDRKSWMKNYRKEYYQKHKDKINQVNVSYYQEHHNEVLEYKKEYYQSHKDESRHSTYLRTYGITLEEYNKFLKNQNYMCKICGTHINKAPKKVLAVDHDHLTGKVRALLCMNCNNGLGCFKDNPNLLQSAFKYLNEFA